MPNSPRHSLVSTVAPPNPRRREAVKNKIASLVQHYLNNLDRHDTNYERREHARHAFATVISLTPVDRSQLAPLGEPLLVIGKQISITGLGFYHTSALLHGCFLVSVPGESVGNAVEDRQLVLQTKWCRFLGKGLYESGGQFVKTVSNEPTD